MPATKALPDTVTGHFLQLLSPTLSPVSPVPLGRLVSDAVARLAAGRHYLLGCVGEARTFLAPRHSSLSARQPGIWSLLVDRLDRHDPNVLTNKI